MKGVGFACLALLRCLAVATANSIADDEESLARQATAAHDYERASVLYRKLAADNPGNAEYRVWIGRLSGYLGKFAPALEAYDAALVIAPDDLDALVGKAYVLLWQRKYSDAKLVLRRAEEIAPESSDVSVANGRLYLDLHQPDRASVYIERALQSDSANAEAIALKIELRPPGNLQLEFSLSGDRLPYASTGVSGAVAVSWISSVNSLSVRVEDWSRYGEQVYRGGLRLSHTFRYRWILEGSTLLGSRGDVLPRWDYALTLKRKLGTRWVLGGQYRDLSFDNAQVRLAAPEVEYYLSRPIWMDGTYSRSWTAFDSVAGSATTAVPADSFLFRYHERIHRFVVHGGYGHGIQLFAIPQANQPGQFKADTFLSGIDIPASNLLTIHLDFLMERRSPGPVEKVFTGTLIFGRRKDQ
jgi:YaiO family outer membrane protein